MASLRAAVTQWRATRDMAANLAIAVDLIHEGATQRADLVLLPENGLMLGTNAEMRAAALAVESAEIDALRAAAARAHTTVVLGGFKRRSAGDAFETYGHALVVNPCGEVPTDLGEAQRACRVVDLPIDKVQSVRHALPVLRGVAAHAYAAVPQIIESLS